MWLDLQNLSQTHKSWNPVYWWTLNLYTLALPWNTKHMSIDSQVCFHRQLFADPVKLWRCTTGSVGSVNGINKDVSSTRLLPTTVLTYSVYGVCFYHLLKTQHCCLCPNGRYDHIRMGMDDPLTQIVASPDSTQFRFMHWSKHFGQDYNRFCVIAKIICKSKSKVDAGIAGYI